VLEKTLAEVPPRIALVGRRNEVSALADALANRQSRLIAGPNGIGKTRLIQEALAISRQPYVSVSGPDVLHRLLVELAQGLRCRSERFDELRQATTIHLKPLVLNKLSEDPCCVVIEDIEDVEPRMYRFLQKLYYVPCSCLIVTSRSPGRLGHLQKLLWDPGMQLVVPPLTHAESLELFENAGRLYELNQLDLDEFRHKVLRAARGNPGQILGMCRLAAQPQYRVGRHIKFVPLRIDVMSALV